MARVEPGRDPEMVRRTNRLSLLFALTSIGLLLPCNVVVREDAEGRIVVGFMDPIAVLKLTDNPGITEIAKDVRARLERVRDQLKG